MMKCAFKLTFFYCRRRLLIDFVSIVMLGVIFFFLSFLTFLVNRVVCAALCNCLGSKSARGGVVDTYFVLRCEVDGYCFLNGKF